MSAGNILVVDDDQNLIELIGLKLHSGVRGHIGFERRRALQAAKQNIFDLCVLDLRLADQDGISLMRELHKINPDVRVIILTGYGSVESAVQAMQGGRLQLPDQTF